MMTFLQAAEAAAAAAEAATVSEETRMGLWTLFTKGGWLMWPLLPLDEDEDRHAAEQHLHLVFELF